MSVISGAFSGLLNRHDIKHGLENDQARIDEFVKDAERFVNELVNTVIELEKSVYAVNTPKPLVADEAIRSRRKVHHRIREELRKEQHAYYNFLTEDY